MAKWTQAFGYFNYNSEEHPEIPEWIQNFNAEAKKARIRPEYSEHPIICNICGDEHVSYESNAVIYGRQYGSGYCYICRKCRSFVGTHEPMPDVAYGTLANETVRNLRKDCHRESERLYSNSDRRTAANRRTSLYFVLAQWLCLSQDQMHFAKMQEEDLKDALEFMQRIDSIQWSKENTGDRIKAMTMRDGTTVCMQSGWKNAEAFNAYSEWHQNARNEKARTREAGNTKETTA